MNKFLFKEDGSLDKEKLVMIDKIFKVITVLFSSGVIAFFLNIHIIPVEYILQNTLHMFLLGCMVAVTMLIIPTEKRLIYGETFSEKLKDTIFIIVIFGLALSGMSLIGWMEIQLLRWVGIIT